MNIELAIRPSIFRAQTYCSNKAWIEWSKAWLNGTDRSAAAAEKAREDAGQRKAAALASNAAMHAAEAITDHSEVSSWVSHQAALHAARASLNYSIWSTWSAAARAAHRAGAPGEALELQKQNGPNRPFQIQMPLQKGGKI